MKIFLKVAFIGAGLALITLAILALAAATQADKLARYQAERVLEHVFKTEGQVESAEVSFLAQTLILHNLSVNNPPGFKVEPALRVRELKVVFEGGTILSDQPVISEIVVSGVKVNLQHNADEGVNVVTLVREAQRTSLERRSQMPRGARREFTVKTLRCEGGRVDFSTAVVPTPGMGLDVAPFTLEEITKDHPVTAGQVSAIFIKSLLVEAATFKGLLRPVAEFLRDELDKLLE